MGKSKKFVFLAGGIFCSFFLYGIIHEKVTKTLYVHPDGSVENFSYSTSLVFIYCAVNYVATMILLKFKDEEDTTPKSYYSVSALVYCLAMLCSNLALQFISYPTQVVAKSSKPIPVMIFGVLLGKKSYSFKKYIFTALIVTGIIMFMYKDAKEEKADPGIGIGELLVLSSLFMDGIYAAIQERMKGDYQTKPLWMMSETNKWAALYLGILCLCTKEVVKFFAFLQKQPTVIWKLSALSLCGFFGQLFIFLTITEFGTLPATIVTAVRKFFTMMVSVLLLGNSLLLRQWIATVIIFLGIFLDILYGKSDTKNK